jgi:ubiquinone/menaquinone biosynthesis C-methylase UbiE
MREADKNDVEMAAHYEPGVEKQRLATWGRLEFIRTTEILSRYLPTQPAVIADVGGGPGAYALWLATQGHEVHLLDPMALHVEQARQASAALEKGGLASAEQGDARELPFADQSVDVALLLGPLYHLVEEEDRLRALEEARRILRPGGLLAAAAISRFASTYDGLTRGFLAEPEFAAIVECDVRDGQHRNPKRHPDWFTTAYFHHPNELRDEVRSAGFDVDALLAVEGPAGWLSDLSAWLDDDARRDVLLTAVQRVESEPSLLGASAHLLILARIV